MGNFYRFVVSMQGSDADEVAGIIEKQGLDAGFNHMAQWDHGEETEPQGTMDEIRGQCGRGTFYYKNIPDAGEYVMFRQCGGLNYSLYSYNDLP